MTIAPPSPQSVGPSNEERRAAIQKRAAETLARRMWLSRLYVSLVVVGLLIAAVPLASILEAVISKGAGFISWSFLSTSQQFPTIMQPNDIGGIWNAIAGSILVDALAFIWSVPVAIILGVALFEFDNVLIRGVRTVLRVLIGMPSILFGIFAFAFLVKLINNGQQVSYAGSFALGFVVIPLVAITAEAALREVPQTLREAGLSLGAKRSSIMMRVIIPYARPRLLTSILLALSRAVGETAPVLFVTGVALLPNWNPAGQVTTLPLMIFNYLGSSYQTERQACWGMALVLIAVVLVLNLTSRIIVTRADRGRQ